MDDNLEADNDLDKADVISMNKAQIDESPIRNKNQRYRKVED